MMTKNWIEKTFDDMNFLKNWKIAKIKFYVLAKLISSLNTPQN
jgi:hypothetical protein